MYVLTTHMTLDSADTMEQRSDEDIVAMCVELLKSIFPDKVGSDVFIILRQSVAEGIYM